MLKTDFQDAETVTFSIPSKARSRSVVQITRGISRFLRSLNRCALTEVVLASGRRADILSIGSTGEIWIIETKSCAEDFYSDNKWPDYRLYCDKLFFASDDTVSQDIFPTDAGLMLADTYGADIIREAPLHILAGARRKEILIRVACVASNRLHYINDPTMQNF